MNCETVRDKLMGYLFGELEQEEARQVALHLKSCPECRAEFQEFRATVNVMEKWPQVDPRKEMIFIAPEENSLRKWLRSVTSVSGLWRWSGRIAFAAIILILFLAGTDIHYSDGQFSLRIGATGDQPQSTLPAETLAAFKKLQQENLYYTQQMLKASEERNKQLLLTGINELSRKFDQQRIADLEYMGENLQRIQKANLYNNSILQDLVSVAKTTYPIKK